MDSSRRGLAPELLSRKSYRLSRTADAMQFFHRDHEDSILLSDPVSNVLPQVTLILEPIADLESFDGARDFRVRNRVRES